MEYVIRTAGSQDIPELKSLWKTAFGDGDQYIDMFFDDLYRPENTLVCCVEGRVASAAYVVELGEFVTAGGDRRPCRAVYAFATLPELRGMGLGSAVIERAADMSCRDGAVGVICPAQYSLFDYYRSRGGYRDHFYIYEASSSGQGMLAYGSARRVDAQEYSQIRRRLLKGRDYIDFSPEAMRFQEKICTMSGGGLFSVAASGVRCAAAAEMRDGEILIKELVVPTGTLHMPALITARALGKESFTYRTPVRPGEEGIPFAMARGISDGEEEDTGLGWYGFAFD